MSKTGEEPEAAERYYFRTFWILPFNFTVSINFTVTASAIFSGTALIELIVLVLKAKENSAKMIWAHWFFRILGLSGTLLHLCQWTGWGSFIFFFTWITILFSHFFYCVQVQLSPFPPTTASHPRDPYLPPLILPSFGFVHVSFIHVPWWLIFLNRSLRIMSLMQVVIMVFKAKMCDLFT